jgi:hypothetical protein
VSVTVAVHVAVVFTAIVAGAHVTVVLVVCEMLVLYPIVTSSSDGVCVGSVVLNCAQYWMYLDAAPIVPPEVEIGVKPLQLAAGAGEFDALTLSATLVPDGVFAVHDRVPHVAVRPASKTREMNVPVAAYGVSRIQSIAMLPPPVLKSLAIGIIVPAMATACVATTFPSTEYVMLLAPQSIR